MLACASHDAAVSRRRHTRPTTLQSSRGGHTRESFDHLGGLRRPDDVQATRHLRTDMRTQCESVV